MFKAKENKGINFPLSIARIVHNNKYLKENKKLGNDHNQKVLSIVDNLLNDISVPLFHDLNDIVKKYFLHKVLIRYSLEYPDMTAKELVNKVCDLTSEELFDYYVNHVIVPKDTSHEAIKEKINLIQTRNTVAQLPTYNQFLRIEKDIENVTIQFKRAIKTYYDIYQLVEKDIQQIEEKYFDFFREQMKASEEFERMVTFYDRPVEIIQKNDISVHVSVFEEYGLIYFHSKRAIDLVIGIGLEEVFSEGYEQKRDLELFQCFADETRLKILRLISSDELCAKDIAECLGLSKATISHHINKMITAGVIALSVKEGKRSYYVLTVQNIEKTFKKYLDEFSGALKSNSK